MEYNPSYNGLRTKPVLRVEPKATKAQEPTPEPENRVTTQRPAPSTPAPRGHA